MRKVMMQINEQNDEFEEEKMHEIESDEDNMSNSL